MTKRNELDVEEVISYLKKLLKTLSAWKGSSNHHIVPKERGGKKGGRNVKNIPGKFHCLLHLFFKNMTIDEMKFFIEFWLNGNKKYWSEKEIYELQGLIIKRKIEDAMNLCQYTSNQQDSLIKNLFGIVETRKIKKLNTRIRKLEKRLKKKEVKGK